MKGKSLDAGLMSVGEVAFPDFRRREVEKREGSLARRQEDI